MQQIDLLKELESAETRDFLANINEPIFRAADIPLTSRIINHWHEKGLFPYQKEAGKWREFSLVDYMWVLFVNRLRMLNVGLESVAKIKEHCFRDVYYLIEQEVIDYMTRGEPGLLPQHIQEAAEILMDPETRSQLESPHLRLFSLWLMVAIKNNQDVLVRIQPDKANTTDFVVLTTEQTNTQQIVKTIAQKGGLFISLQALLNEFYGSERFTWENIQKLEIDAEARKVIGIMREKGLKEVVIHLNNGVVKRIQTEHEVKRMNITELSNAIASKKYVDFRVVKNEGDQLIVSFKESHVLTKNT